MNVIVWLALDLVAFRAALWAFQDINEPAIGWGFAGLFLAGFLVTIKQAIDDYTGRGDNGTKEGGSSE